MTRRSSSSCQCRLTFLTQGHYASAETYFSARMSFFDRTAPNLFPVEGFRRSSVPWPILKGEKILCLFPFICFPLDQASSFWSSFIYSIYRKHTFSPSLTPFLSNSRDCFIRQRYHSSEKTRCRSQAWRRSRNWDLVPYLHGSALCLFFA